MMKYSFIVPIYNVEEYLCRCIDSMLAQTYKEYEIILIDDGSTDSSGAIADSYAEKYKDKIIVEHQVNTGLGGARNKGITLSTGEYLVMVDSDDYISEKMLEVVDFYLSRNKNDILIFDFVIENEDGEKIIQHLHNTKGYEQITDKKFISETPAAWNKIYRASLFKENNIRYPARIFYEDLATTPCLAIHACNIGVIDEALYYYIQRESSIMHSKNADRMTEICIAVEHVLDYYKQQGKFEKYHDELEFLTVSHVLCSAIQRILCVGYDYRKIKFFEQFVQSYFPNYQKNSYVQKWLFDSEEPKVKWIVKRQYGRLYIEYIVKKCAKTIIRFVGRKRSK